MEGVGWFYCGCSLTETNSWLTEGALIILVCMQLDVLVCAC